ncbi:MAG TPA: GtrA family protein [Bordetella sp.]
MDVIRRAKVFVSGKLDAVLIRQLIKFLLVGSVVAVVQFVLLFLFVERIGIDATYASCIAYVICSMLNYFLNYRFTFQANISHGRALWRFWVIALIGLAMNGLFMKIGTAVFMLNYIYAQICATGGVILWNFFANRKWTYAA